MPNDKEEQLRRGTIVQHALASIRDKCHAEQQPNPRIHRITAQEPINQTANDTHTIELGTHPKTAMIVLLDRIRAAYSEGEYPTYEKAVRAALDNNSIDETQYAALLELIAKYGKRG